MFLLQASGFILMPLYTHYLPPADYGILELVERSVSFLFILTMANGLGGAVFSFYCQSDSQTERTRLSASLLIATLFSLLACGLLIVLFGDFLASSLSIDNTELFVFGLTTGMLQLLPATMMALIQARMQAVRYLAFGMTFLCVRIICLVLTIVVFQQGLWGVFIANLIATIISTTVLTLNEYLPTGFHPSWQTFIALLNFSWPFIPNGILGFILWNADRFFLVRHTGIETLGIFSLAAKVAGIVGVIAFAPLYKSWSAHMYVVFANQDAQKMAGKWFTMLLFPSCYLGLAISLFQGEIVQTLSASAYHDAHFWVAPLVLCGILIRGQVLTDGPLYARRRTGLKPIISGIAAGITVLSMAILTPRLQLLGVIIALLISASTLWGLTYLFSRRVMRIDYEWKRLLIMIGSAVLFAIPTYVTFPGRLEAVLLKLILLVLWPVTLWLLGFFEQHELDRLKSTLQKLIRMLPFLTKPRRRFPRKMPRNLEEHR